MVRLKGLIAPPELKDLESKISEIKIEKESAIKNEEFEKAAHLRDEEQQLLEELEEKRNHWRSNRGRSESVVSEEDISYVVAIWTGIPVTKIAEEESVRLLNLEEALHERVMAR